MIKYIHNSVIKNDIWVVLNKLAKLEKILTLKNDFKHAN